MSLRSRASSVAAAARHLVDLGLGERAAVEQQLAVADDADDRRLAEAKRLGQLGLERAGEALDLRERQGAAAGAGDRRLDRTAGERASRSARARTTPAGSVSIRRQGSPRAPARVAIERERGLERGERDLVDPQRAVQRVAAQPLDEVGAADDDARPAGRRAACRREKQTRSAPAARLSRAVGSSLDASSQDAASRDRRRARGLRGRASAASSASGGCSVKPTMRKLDWCTRSSTRGRPAPIARS